LADAAGQRQSKGTWLYSEDLATGQKPRESRCCSRPPGSFGFASVGAWTHRSITPQGIFDSNGARQQTGLRQVGAVDKTIRPRFLARSQTPFLAPKEWETVGQVRMVVFVEGAVSRVSVVVLSRGRGIRTSRCNRASTLTPRQGLRSRLQPASDEAPFSIDLPMLFRRGQGVRDSIVSYGNERMKYGKEK